MLGIISFQIDYLKIIYFFDIVKGVSVDRKDQ